MVSNAHNSTVKPLHLKVLVKSKVAVHDRSDGLAIGNVLLVLRLLRRLHHARLLVVAHPLLEEVGLARERDVLHEVEGVGGVEEFAVAECKEQAIGDELDVLVHEVGVHAEQCTRQGVGQELLLDGHCFDDDALDQRLVGLVLEMREEEAGEVGVHALVTGDEFVGEGEAGHQSTLLQPEDGSKGAGEEDALHSGEGDEAACKGRVLVGDPSQRPVSLLTDAWDVVDGVEEVCPLLGFADVGVDEEGVGLGVDVFHHDLKPVKAACFRYLHFTAESLDQVLIDDAIGCCEECKNV